MYFKLKTSEQVYELLDKFQSTGIEKIPVPSAFLRVNCRDIYSPEDLPGFQRSCMDGYAIKAKDSFGANEIQPAFLNVIGEVKMGTVPDLSIHKGEAVKISTGGMVPKGADSVIMIEHCHILNKNEIEISKAVSPLENIILADEDVKKNNKILKNGCSLRAQELGLLSGLGLSEIEVYKRPLISIISTGSEIIKVDDPPQPGQIRDINSITLKTFCKMQGADSKFLGICRDDFNELKNKVEQALNNSDCVWISGGSSVGTKDLTLQVIKTFKDSEILAHGISISPGKPTIIARIGTKPVIGIPGHTASAMIVAHIFLSYLIKNMSGVNKSNLSTSYIEAELGRNIESKNGREDYVRVSLEKKGETLIAKPIFGKSGLISTLVDAQGLIKIERNNEGLYKGDIVKTYLFDQSIGGIF